MYRTGVLMLMFAACDFSHGRLPDGGTMPDVEADAMPDAPGCGAAQVATGANHTCARTFDGSLYCWGLANSGQIGALPLTYRCPVGSSMFHCETSPRRVELTAVTALGLGNEHTCASTAAGAFCWGVNLHGAFGDGTTMSGNTPRAIAARDGASTLEGGAYHSCSMMASTLLCSGQNAAGEVGDGSGMRQTSVVSIDVSAASYSLGDYTSCALSAQGELACWGHNQYAQIDGTLQNKLVPTPIPAVGGVVQVATARSHICAVRDDKTAICWGNNTYGQLGNAMTAMYSSIVEVLVPNVVEVAANARHSCVRDEAGAVYCFGEGYSPTPEKIDLARPAISITAGAAHDCAITDDYEVWCWGNQDVGQLGNGVNSSTRTLTPQRAPLCP